MKNKKISIKISIMLIFCLFSNFIVSSRVDASATAVVGSVKLLEFLLVCATVGVAFDSLQEANKMMVEFEKKYPDRPPNDSKNAILNLLGIYILDKFGDVVSKVVDFVKDLGA